MAAECREAFFQQVDVADPASVEAHVRGDGERYGGIDVLYNNAGIMPAEDASVLEPSRRPGIACMDVNAKGVFLCCRHGIPHLLERGGGSVINVASFVALVGAATSQIAYTASKGAVLSLTPRAGGRVRAPGRAVNALCPGPVETPLLHAALRGRPGGLRAAARPPADGPAGQGPRDRDGALFLACDESSYVTGTTFLVDGGLTAAYVTPE